uniref:Uncharacterized protein n=1 Tax=Siphoviridae sp. ctm8l1 TaxID=2827930 RepID=A0A8S5T4A5_9CAUD|nr:MAG TPA: hypothetical protein [Siphoviridae sp. ctm8l1]
MQYLYKVFKFHVISSPYRSLSMPIKCYPFLLTRFYIIVAEADKDTASMKGQALRQT